MERRRSWRWCARHSVAGSFSVPGAKGRLVFENLRDRCLFLYSVFAVGFADESGATQVSWVSDWWRGFLTLGRDSATGLDHVMIEQQRDGFGVNEVELWHCDASAGGWCSPIRSRSRTRIGKTCDGRLHRLPSAWPSADGEYRWRGRKAAEHVVAEVLDAFEVGDHSGSYGSRR